MELKIDQSDFTLIKNKEKALTVSDDPSVHDDVIDQKVWSSSDEKIATVDQNGNVKAIKEGVAVISVTYYVGNRTGNFFCKSRKLKKFMLQV